MAAYPAQGYRTPGPRRLIGGPVRIAGPRRDATLSLWSNRGVDEPVPGYVADHLAEDAGRWLAGAYRPTVAADVRSVESFAAALPATAGRALAHWDRMARAGAIPDMFAFEEGGLYGFDFVAEQVSAVDGGRDVSDRLWMLGHEGGGNGYVVLPSGEIGIWDHESGAVGRSGRFASLDVFGWAIVRCGAAEAGALDVDEVIDRLSAQGSGGCAFLAGRLRDEFED
jgi:hypothetical protein